MNAWMTLWTAVLLGALTLFTCLSVTVAIGALLDMRKMFGELRRQHEESSRSKDALRR